MKTTILYDQGSAKFPEDGIIFTPPYYGGGADETNLFYFGVTDGVSGIYLPQEGPRFFHGRTGGQCASSAITRAFGSALPGEYLEDILLEANNMIRRLSKANGLSLEESEFLPSATFVVVSVIQKSINILQGGDSLAVWLNKDGTIGGTPNQAFVYEEDLLNIVSALMKKHGKDRQKMWEEFRPVLVNKRRANTNNAQGNFALINGQSEVEKFWQKFILRREDVALLILFSDGFVPFEWTRDEKYLAEKVVSLYQVGGLYAILKETRVVAEQKKYSSHEDCAEATAIAIEF